MERISNQDALSAYRVAEQRALGINILEQGYYLEHPLQE
jgi:hypothetical protein